jgi:hypothetical protein
MGEVISHGRRLKLIRKRNFENWSTSGRGGDIVLGTGFLKVSEVGINKQFLNPLITL